MQAMVISTTPSVWTVRVGMQGLPDPVRRPPGRPPQEPIIIIIKIPPRLPEVPEIDRSDEEEEDAEIRRPPEIPPELPPPRSEDRVRQEQRRHRTWRSAGC